MDKLMITVVVIATGLVLLRLLRTYRKTKENAAQNDDILNKLERLRKKRDEDH